MSANELVLVDLSSIAHPIWHVSQSEPDPNHASQQIVARVRALTSGHPHAAVCCDSGRSFRHDISDAYKANRPAAEAPLHHQIALAKEQLAADGFPVWAVKGFEADDLVAAGVTRALEMEDVTVLIVTADKDLLQLVGPRVRAMSVRDGSILDAEGVFAKFGVTPAQMRDYLCLVGDKADNVTGAKGIGEKRAAELLAYNGSIEVIYQHLDDNGSSFTPSVATSLREFRQRLDTTRALITLRTDIELPFEEISAERVATDAATFGTSEDEAHEDPPSPATTDVQGTTSQETAEPERIAPEVDGQIRRSSTEGQTALSVRESEALSPTPAREGWELEPRSMKDAKALSVDMFQSRLFSAYGHPAAILSTVMAGRELGMQAMASLRAFHIIDGKPTLAADLIRALVIRSGAAKYFRCTERTAERATFETQRGDDPPIVLSYTIAEAQASGRVKESSAYKRDPADVLVARASSKLARLVYPDVTHGLYSAEEMD